MQTHFDHASIHSGNLYQIFTYVKNKAAASDDTVSGLLLYAKTQEAITPDFEFSMSGNRIGAKTLDLNADFEQIKRQLDEIAQEYLSV
jgi:5-methylcytosine-specific restriction enzyme subunit McrC